MTDNMNPEDSNVQRLSRLASSQPKPASVESDEVVREYEERYNKPKRDTLRAAPRSYSSVSVSDTERKWTAAAHATKMMSPAVTSLVVCRIIIPSLWTIRLANGLAPVRRKIDVHGALSFNAHAKAIWPHGTATLRHGSSSWWNSAQSCADSPTLTISLQKWAHATPPCASNLGV